MKIIFTLLAGLLFFAAAAQKQTFDLVTYIPPKGWKKEIKPAVAATYSFTDKKDKSWCRAGIFKSTLSKGGIDADFESEWNDLIVKQYAITDPPQTTEVQEADGWKVKAGSGRFVFNNKDAAVLLTTFSGYGVCLSIVVVTGNQRYLADIEKLVASVELKKPAVSPSAVITQPDNNNRPAINNTGFTFTTTNFDDGWTSTVQEDWVEVTKGTTRVLIHYPNKKADEYNPVLLDGLKNAWDILVAPRYSSATNFEFKPISNWESIEFARADMIENATGKAVHVVLFKKNYSNGSGKFLEFISPDKNSFETEFGAYHETSYGWEKMENMAFRNKFAVAAADLAGKWTSNFSGTTQYVNVYTGLDAGMDTHASVENFLVGPGNTYKWDLGVASGPVGNIKFQSVKSNGRFAMQGNWKVNFSDIEGKPRTYDVSFSCIKGLRILWLDDKPFAKAE